MNIPVPPAPPSNATVQNIPVSTTSTGTLVPTTAGPPLPPPGQTLAATVLSRVAPGQFILQTDNGTLTLQTAAVLANGLKLNLQIQSLGTRPQVLLLPNPGQSPTTVPSGNAIPPPPPVVTATLTQGSTASAILLRPAASGNASGTTASTANTPPASISSTNVASVTSTPAGTQPVSVGAGGGNTATGQVSVPVPASAGSSIVNNPLPAGTTFTVRIVAVSPPGTPLSPTVVSGPNVMLGSVTGTTPTGQTIVQTSLGEIAVSARSTLPRGSQVTLQLAGSPNLPSPLGDSSSLLVSQHWETLRAAIAALQSSDPAAARTLTQQVLPQGGGPITTGMLFFLSAILTGDVRRWMGEESMRVLQRTSGNLLDRLRQDFGDMRRMATEPSGQEWRSYLIPILVGGELEQLKLFIRGEREQEDEKNSDKKRGTRFVIEVEFSRLGPFQFDGLTQEKTIDLMVRTRDPLVEKMQEDIRQIFTNAVSALGFSGVINFHRSQSFELNPTQEMYAQQSGLTV